jgi:broad specificity phosphatase PhoE
MSPPPGTPDTVVHLLRHGEVHNPAGVLYGRRDGFHLSELGKQMAEKVAESIQDRDIVHLRSSPLERARETAAPLALARGLDVVTDERVIESTNVFEGISFGGGAKALRNPKLWRHLWNPIKPSWGEPYKDIVQRMMAAVHEARVAAAGHEAVIVSHQLPIWTTRLHVEKRSFLHDPRRRQCTLCSLTSFHFVGERLTQVSYSEPAGELIPRRDKSAPLEDREDPVEISGDSLEEEPIDLADWRGEVVVVNVWGSWCTPCRSEAPILVDAAAGLDARFVGIDIRDHSDDALAFEREFGIEYPSIFDPGSEQLLRFGSEYPPHATPSTYVLDRKGRVAALISGAVPSLGTLTAVVEEVAAEDG